VPPPCSIRAPLGTDNFGALANGELAFGPPIADRAQALDALFWVSSWPASGPERD